MYLILAVWLTWGCLDVTSTHKPTTRHSNPHHMSTQHSVRCDNLLLWHFGPLTFCYCNRWTQWHFTLATLCPPFDTSRKLTSTPPKSRTFCHCNRTSTFFYLDCDRTSTFALKRNVDVLSQVTWEHLEALWLVSQRVDKMSQWSKSSRGKLLKVAVASKRAVGLEK
jgi:hypothetical protein